MRRLSSFFIVIAIPFASACSSVSGGDDTSAATTVVNADAGEVSYYSDTAPQDSGSETTPHDSGTSGSEGSTIDFDGGAFTTRPDAGSNDSD